MIDDIGCADKSIKIVNKFYTFSAPSLLNHSIRLKAFTKFTWLKENLDSLIFLYKMTMNLGMILVAVQFL